jgi:hypothetical protein
LSVPSLINFKNLIGDFHSDSFESIALEVFQFQAEYNSIYQSYLAHLGVAPFEITSTNEIPFLPIEFFKSFDVKTGSWVEKNKFLSSGTTSILRSSHSIEDLQFYLTHTQNIYEQFYPKLTDTTILALLPSYLEQGGSGLVSMIDSFITKSNSGNSGFYLNNYKELEATLIEALDTNKPVVLFGVTYALLDFACKTNKKFEQLIVIETGGMKGRREELTKAEIHVILKEELGVDKIHSEYGMTELLSQAYSQGEGIFESPKTMKVVIKDINDPFKTIENESAGVVNVFDLANVHSCCFIETKDIGKRYENGRFEILGRMDNSEARGCNLLIS